MKGDSQDKLICIKVGLFCIILFFWVTGVSLICVGASVQMKLSDISVVIAETSSGAPLVLTIMGMIIFFLSGFGALAAIKENSLLIKIFTVMMLLVFAAEIIVGISAYSYRTQLQRSLLLRFLRVLDKYGEDRRITRGIDGVQQDFQCCGGRNYTDWYNATARLAAMSVPPSCCRSVQVNCGENATAHADRIYQEGCVMKMQNWVTDHIDVIGAVGVGLGFSQFIGILFSFLLVKILQETYVAM
ncbi:CD63 antigen-like [Gastrophryne carolinensis]